MQNKAPDWVMWVMRAGYGARGVVYLIVGALALAAVWWGGQAQGTKNAVADLKALWFGDALLVLIGLGLVAYMVWRLIDAAMDLEAYGHDAEGIAARCGQVITGLLHGAIGISIAAMAFGGDSGQGESGVETWTAKVMALPYGGWIVMAAGAGVIGAGIYYAQKGLRETYKRDIRVTETARKLEWVIKTGYVAEGVVVAIIGGFLFYAGVRADPDQAGGVGQALGWVRGQSYGGILFAMLAVGLLCFSVTNFAQAAFRVVPRHDGDDVETLADKARAEVAKHT
ncbi:DUF1206 domain-containing protein [Roseovarius sp. SCSIO 43702]|uniref:DUF1206 domain-containing protein n=1 Tax=Roseovarius sp. SCSIO 43702 TaxID=2823043 RepID=UPI001C72B9AB|nr:DUF1206 domain-containing protein [Roseovarius sp. SCSIO 43702]QYX57607.1 DUF1206 domain-containing protein [Roseovarius sp. SCSIO 43702]